MAAPMPNACRGPKCTIGWNGGMAVLLLWGGTAMMAVSDEGMWLLNDPPRTLLKEKYGYELTEEWLQRAMKASVRLNSGGSGGFVSPEGLLVTNHHVAADAVQKLSKPGVDLYHHGFYAARREEELKCLDLEVNVLQEIVDVTAEVNAAVKEGMSPAQAAAARRARKRPPPGRRRLPGPRGPRTERRRPAPLQPQSWKVTV